jgi:aspartyl-tRNA(Asn)/glutamyl-tRNA(Gln) amidotransferase subunit A
VSPDLAGLTIVAASKELAARRLSAVELVEGTLAAVDRDNDRLNAYLYVDRESALAAARRAQEGLDDGSAGPMAGIPICVKDVIHVAGMPTTAGSSGWSRLPGADAAAVARLREAGAVVVGKGNTNEFAFGIDGRNPHRGDCRNPRDPTRISGGSSAGPASATAADLPLAALGPTPAARFGCQRRCAGWSRFAPRMGWFRRLGSSHSPGRTTQSGRWHGP